MEIAIIGGGASGTMCAIKLLENNKNNHITIFEQNSRLLQKVLKTGNGKCNIMNNNINSSFYNDFSLLENRDVDVYNELSNLGILLKEMTLGRVYPYSEQASTVVNAILKKLDIYKNKDLDIYTDTKVLNVSKDKDLFLVETSNGSFKFDKVVFASGSIAQEKTNCYDILKKNNIKISNLSPGLVPFETKEKTKHLSGIRIKCNASINDITLNGEILFKDNGLSGILALDISRYIKENDIVYLDLMPEYKDVDIYNLLNKGNLLEKLEGIFPKMIAKELFDKSNGDINKLVKLIKKLPFTVLKKRDFNESQITIGGVLVNEITSNFESIKNKGLYVIGETLNVDGASGGYNLYFAWLSGIICANDILKNK